jgi:NTE family protein
MLGALADRGIVPDLVLGTSVGAINGAAFAADPSVEGVERLAAMWTSMQDGDVFSGSLLGRVATLARTRTHLHDSAPLRALLTAGLGDARIEDLAVPFQCVAASIERAAERWFTDGNLIDAVLASSAVPGLLPPVELDGEHYLDGGLVHSIPVGRAVALGADKIYVLHVGRIDRPLRPPTWPWEVGLVAFEIARRHRFSADLAALPPGVTVHVLPSGDPPASGAGNLRYRDFSGVPARIEQAHIAARGYLAGVGASRSGGA